jgi:hypothetical protein
MQNDKPIIRHCENCKWRCYAYGYNCEVTYKWIVNKRLSALFCRYFKAKGGVEDATN